MDQLDKITQYIDGTLPLKEKHTFEAEMKADKTLARKVATHYLIGQALRSQPNKQENQDLELPPLPDEPPPNNNRTFRFISVALAASSVAIVLFFGIRWFIPATNETPQMLYTKYFAYQPSETTMGGTQPNAETTLEKATLAFNQKQFEEAVALLKPLQKSEPELKTAWVLLARSLMEQKNWKEATILLDQYADDDTANWLSAGVALAQNDQKQAKKILQKIVRDGSSDAQKAKEILKAIH